MLKLNFLFTSLLAGLMLFAQTEENYNMVVRSHLPFSGKTCANIWGYTDANGKEYALVGTSTGLEIVDISDPDAVDYLFSIPSVENFWREVRTHETYAYVTTEGANAGLLIVDLSNLPASIETSIYRGDGLINNQLQTIHTIHIEDGYAYCYGSNIQEGGAVILSLADPFNPQFVGQYGARYIHDGTVRDNLMYASHIFDGFFAVIDVSNKANPVVLAQQETPGNFTHNTWLNDASDVVFTTDENENSFLAAYRIDDLNNITELDRYQTAPGSNAIVHNTHLKDDFAFTSWYTEGVVIVDGKRPTNLVEVAKYDFSAFEGSGFNGCWGVYPYFPSGNIVASDIETGLWVLTPDLKRAAYLEGNIRDSICDIPLEAVEIEIVGLGALTTSDLNGNFKTGTPFTGVYDIKISRPGYETLIVSNVELIAEQVININVALFSDQIVQLLGNVGDVQDDAIQGAFVRVNNAEFSYNFQSDADGNFSRCNLVPGDYNYVVGKWGYVTECGENILIDPNNNDLNLNLQDGYYDDFSFNFGWTVQNTATAGFWERGIPVGTSFLGAQSNPEADINGDCGQQAFVTGNSGGQAGADDVDDGFTKLISPVFDGTLFEDPFVSYYYWWFNAGGNSPVDDYLRVEISNGNETVLLQNITSTTGPMSRWTHSALRIRDFIQPSSNMRVTFEAADLPPNGHLVEAGLDLFRVFDSTTVNISKHQQNDINVWPVPVKDELNIDLSKFRSEQFPAELSLYDMSGSLQKTVTISSQVDLFRLETQLASGLYFLQITTADRKLVSRKVPVLRE
jgi:choice-of-anchor B domain-containing protein